MTKSDLIQEMVSFCRSLAPGERLPTHTELMRRFGLSERVVLSVLSALQQSGLIVRKNGVGTFIAETAPQAEQRLQERETTIVAVTPPDHAYFKYCTEVLYEQVRGRGLSVVCHFVDEDNPILPPSLLSDETAPSGFLLFRYRLSPLALRLQEQGRRVVVLGVPPAGVTPPVPCVYADHEQSGYLQVRHLVEQGHRRLLIAHPENDLYETLRWQGHQRAQRGTSDVQITIVQGAESDTALLETLQHPNAPTAVICWNDNHAAKVLALLNRHGIPVPGQVALMGCDNLPEGTLVHPSLSTIDNGIDRLIGAALDLLTRSPAPPPTVISTTIPTLIPRASTEISDKG